MKNGNFKKGHTPWNKGLKGTHFSKGTEFKKGQIPWNKGKKLSKEYRDKLSEAHKGKMVGPKNPNWKGEYTHTNGYILVNVGGKRIYKHRYVMQEFIGRNLKRFEVVHHKNHDKTDNRIENLEIIDNKSHSKLHTPKGSKVGINSLTRSK